MPEFTVHVLSRSAGQTGSETAWIIRLQSDLDVCGKRLLTRTVRDCLARQANCLVLDLRDLEFLDSEGIRAMLQARRDSVEGGCCLCVVRPLKQSVRQVLALVGLDKLLPIADAPAASAPPALLAEQTGPPAEA